MTMKLMKIFNQILLFIFAGIGMFAVVSPVAIAHLGDSSFVIGGIAAGSALLSILLVSSVSSS